MKNNYKLHILDCNLRSMDVVSSDTLKEFKDCLFDSVLNKYLDSDGNSDKLNEFLENILFNKYTSEDYKQMLMDVIV